MLALDAVDLRDKPPAVLNRVVPARSPGPVGRVEGRRRGRCWKAGTCAALLSVSIGVDAAWAMVDGAGVDGCAGSATQGYRASSKTARSLGCLVNVGVDIAEGVPVGLRAPAPGATFGLLLGAIGR